jgi:hypothetical protein
VKRVCKADPPPVLLRIPGLKGSKAKSKEKATGTATKYSENFSENELFNYLSVEENRQKVLQKALKLNGGKYVNACVYFIAEALRQNGAYIPSATCNTIGLAAELKSKGWTRSSEYTKLRPGDICFTTDNGDGSGVPSHTYVFMGWISADNYDYAMVCDNQADRYGTVYHKRNIAKIDVYNGEKKEAFQFFMRK